MAQQTVEIQVGNIEEELNRLWKSQSQNNQVRACLFNLIIYSHDQRRTAYLHQIVQAILEKFPCRIIFIQVNKDTTEDYLRTSVSSAVIRQGDINVACDQINIDVTEKLLDRVPFVIYPILVPDLPLYLVWGQNPMTENIILPKLQSYASRLIFDSECAENLSDFSQKILKLLDKTKIEVRDVKWAAVGGWRDVFTQVFDTLEKIEQLRNCREIQITYNGRKSVFVSHTEIPSIYLQAWLAAQFQWKFIALETKEELRHFSYRCGQHEIHVTLIPEDIPNLSAGTITSVQIQTSAEDETSYSMIRQPAPQPRVALHIANREKCEIPYYITLNELKNSTALMTEIFYRKTSNHYRNMLSMIANINTKEGKC